MSDMMLEVLELEMRVTEWLNQWYITHISYIFW